MAVIEMAVADWINVKDNPRQRNTIKRAQLAVRRHLSCCCKIHRYVYAASKNGHILCKLDGHVRAYLWQEGMLDLPPDGKVEVLLIEVASIREAKEVYEQLDSPPALKRPSDRVYGAARENGFALHSHLLRSCSFSTQLKVADSGSRFAGDVYLLVRKWKPQLIALDELDLTSNYTVLIAAMLVSIRRDGPDIAGPFWITLDRDEGTKFERGADGPEALHKHMEIRRAQRTTAGWENLWSLQCVAWDAYTKWSDNKRVQRLKMADFGQVVEACSKEKAMLCR